MNIHIVNYETGIKSGILTKYADMMVNGLIREGHEVTISGKPDPKADINHHINYESFQPCKTVNTAMVTHIDTETKLKKMKEVAKVAHGVCFSNETMKQLVKEGIKKESLSVILPATSMTRRPRIVAIMTQLYPDGRKREGMFLDLVKTLDNEKFVWNIVGKGWEPIIEKATKLGAKILHVGHFTPELGQGVLNSADYLLYFGKDEGAISVLDATMAGVKTIAPLVGFHKELGIDYPFDTQKELNEIFAGLSENKADNFLWEAYVKSHIQLWGKLR